ncbi:MAG: hypothetical protein NTV34_18020, partial [Proteobacteria bacterium]|nr:hypothetical protein [Pseudomonadota bacterium]
MKSLFLPRLALSFKLARKGLRVNPAFSIVMATNIALGVLGYLVVEGFNDSFLVEIRGKTRATAAGDLIASVRVQPSQETIARLNDSIPKGSEVSVEQSLLTMASGKNSSRLIEVRFIDENFPLYGNIKLTNGGTQSSKAGAKLSGTLDAWIYPELRSQLGVNIGDPVKLGAVTYTV